MTSTSESGAGAQLASQAVSAAQEFSQDMDNAWPMNFYIMLWIALAVYVLLVSPSLARRLTSGNWKRGWILRSRPAATEQGSGPTYAPAHSVSHFFAAWRGMYNHCLLPIIPWLHLTVAQCFVLLFYLVCVSLATFAKVGTPGQDNIRSGRIAVAQMPVLFILATKNNLLCGFGKTYEKLNFIHRFAGRCVIFCGLLHSGYFIKKIAHEGRLKLLGGGVQTTGLVAAIALSVMLLTSLSPVRRLAYQTFIVSHVAGWIVLVVSVYLHCEYAKPWIIISLSVLGLDYVVRMLSTRLQTASLVAIGSHDGQKGFTQIRVQGIKSGWSAGQHVWIRRTSSKYGLQAHPFTIANSPELDSLTSKDGSQGLTLYAKDCGDFTNDLHKVACQNGGFGDAEKGDSVYLENIGTEVKLSIEGPYGGSHTRLAEFETVMLVAGGSGITYVLSVLSDLVASSMTSRCPTRRVKVVYVVRELSSAAHFVPLLGELVVLARTRTASLRLEVDFYHTGSDSSGNSEAGPLDGLKNVCFRQGRPELSLLLSMFLHESKPMKLKEGRIGGGAVVAVCGPRHLIAAARNAATSVEGQLAYAVGGIAIQTETFGW